MKNTLLIAFVSLIVLAGCNQIKPVKTIEDLKAGFKGETTASAKYTAFAQKARDENNENVAKLFDAASKSESIHASNHQKAVAALGEKMDEVKPEFEVKTTVENLKAAIDGETQEVTSMYPQFLSDAKAEKAEKANKSFTWAFDTEKKHQQFYTQALAALNASTQNTLPVEYAVCPVCGNTYDKNKSDEKCAFCQASKAKFISI